MKNKCSRMRGNTGAALVLVIMAMALLTAIGLSLSILANIEMRVAANHSHAHEALSAAETALELTAQGLMTIADWPAVASGTVRSSFTDGSAAGTRVLADGTTISLPVLTSGLGDPAWRLFAHGPESIWGLPISAYVVVWARRDPSDGTAMILRADALGAGGARRAVQASVGRSRVLSWEELR